MTTIHCCRFIQYTPSTTHRIVNNPYSKYKSVAISRGSGNVEIWEYGRSGYWNLISILPSTSEYTIECLLWIDDRTIILGSMDGQLHVWDTLELIKKNTLSAIGGTIWCMERNEKLYKFVCGCEDGTLALYNYKNCVSYEKALVRIESGRLLCCSWHREGDRLAVGTDTGIIFMFHVPSGTTIFKTDSELIEDFSRATFWTLSFLNDDALVSGNSNGTLCIWDAKIGNVLKSLSVHKADILALVVDPLNQHQIYTASVDGTVCRTKKIDDINWIVDEPLRCHTNDLHSLALIPVASEHNSKAFNSFTLISGGVDGMCIEYEIDQPLNSSGLKVAEKFAFFPPMNSMIQLSRSTRMILYHENHVLKVWRLAKKFKSHGKNDGSTMLQKPGKLLLESKVNHSTIFSAYASPHGHLIICSCVSPDKVIVLDISNIHKDIPLHQKLTQRTINQKNLNSFACGVFDAVDYNVFHSINFQKVLTSIDLISSSVVRSLDLTEHLVSFAPRSIFMKISPNSRYLGIFCNNSDGNSFIIDIKQNTSGLVKINLPTFQDGIIAAEFGIIKTKKDGKFWETLCLFVLTGHYLIFKFHILEGKLESDEFWSEKLQNSNVINKLFSKQSFCVGMSVDSEKDSSFLLLHNSRGFLKIPLITSFSDDYSEIQVKIIRSDQKGSKRKLENEKIMDENDSIRSVSLCFKYSPILFASTLSNSEIVVVERSLADIYSTQPAAMYRKKFGQS